MDEFNNDKNPFDEQPSGGQDVNPYAQQGGQQQNVDPYAQQGGNPYNQQAGNPYNQPNPNPYNQQPQQNGNPYNQQMPNISPYQQTPYNRSNQQNFNPYAQQGGWQGMQQAQYNAVQQSTGMATASLVLGIISIVMGLPALALPFLFLIPIIGLILGIVYKTKHLPVGKGLSTAGIITSSIGLVLPIVIVFIAAFWLIANGAEAMEYIRQISPELYEEYREQFGDQFPEWFTSVLYFIFK